MQSQKTAKNAIMRLINVAECFHVLSIPPEINKSGEVDRKSKSATRCISRAINDLERRNMIAVHRDGNGTPQYIATVTHAADGCTHVHPNLKKEDPVTASATATELANNSRAVTKAETLTKALKFLQDTFAPEERFTPPEAIHMIAEALDITVANARNRESQLRSLNLLRVTSETEMIVTHDTAEVTLQMVSEIKNAKYIPIAKSVQELRERKLDMTDSPTPIAPQTLTIEPDVSDETEEPHEPVHTYTPKAYSRILLRDIKDRTAERDKALAALELATTARETAEREAADAKNSLEILRTAHRDLEASHTALIEESVGTIDSVEKLAAQLKEAQEANTNLQTQLQQLQDELVVDEEVVAYIQSRSQS